MSHINTSHVTHTNESCHTCQSSVVAHVHRSWPVGGKDDIFTRRKVGRDNWSRRGARDGRRRRRKKWLQTFQLRMYEREREMQILTARYVCTKTQGARHKGGGGRSEVKQLSLPRFCTQVFSRMNKLCYTCGRCVTHECESWHGTGRLSADSLRFNDLTALIFDLTKPKKMCMRTPPSTHMSRAPTPSDTLQICHDLR